MSTAEYAAPKASGRTVTPDLLDGLNLSTAVAAEFSLVTASTGAEKRPVAEDRRSELIERLAQRSVRADGFDRAALADARRAWT
jgi:hypothetical protein